MVADDPVYTVTPEGNSAASFTIAVPYTGKTDFFKVVAYGKQAESLTLYGCKHRNVRITGRIEQDTRERVFITAEYCRFCSS